MGREPEGGMNRGGHQHQNMRRMPEDIHTPPPPRDVLHEEMQQCGSRKEAQEAKAHQ